MIGVDHLEQGAVALEEVDEEPDGLLVHRPAQGRELREDLLALLVVLVETADLEPLAGELGGQRARPSGPASMRRTWPARTSGSWSLPSAARLRSSGSGIDDQRK